MAFFRFSVVKYFCRYLHRKFPLRSQRQKIGWSTDGTQAQMMKEAADAFAKSPP